MTFKFAKLHACSSVAAVAMGLLVDPAIAQSAAETDVEAGEIIVTANKREQSLNDVGLSIQAASGQDLQSRGIGSPADLAKLVPGFTFTQSLYSTPVYTLRGIGLYDATFGAAPSVSVYTDQVPRNVPVMSDALDLDIERVEVLKGPQGTLFGQSSTGGAINYIVGKPTEEFHAGANASYERFNLVEIGGYVSGPLGEGASARLAVKNVSGGAWQRSLSRPNDENGDSRKLMGRLTVDLQPTDGVKVELMATGVRDRSDPLAPQYAGTAFNYYPSLAAVNGAGASPIQDPTQANPYGVVDLARYTAITDPASPGFDPSFRGPNAFAVYRQAIVVARLHAADGPNPTAAQIAAAAGARAILGTAISDSARDAEWTPGLLGKSDNSYYQFSGRADVDLSQNLKLTYIGAVANKQLAYNQDLDATVATVVDVPLDGKVKALNQELRLAYDTAAVHAIVGASYDNIRTRQHNDFNLAQYTGNFGLITQTSNDFTSKQKSYSMFGNVEAEVSDGLTVHGGIRYTKNKLGVSYCYNDPASDTAQGTAFVFGALLNNPPIAIGPGECFALSNTFVSSITPVNQSLDQDNVSFRVGLNYKLDQGTLLYATISQGYKAGIFSAIGASKISQYVPAVQEKVVAYEAGIKAPLAGNKLQFNAAGFYYDYSDKQVRGRILDPIFGLLEKMVNVPKSRIYGIEGELTARPVERLTLSTSATYLKTKVTGDFSTTPDGDGIYNAQGYTGNFRGSELPYSPKFSANADAQYEIAVTDTINGFLGGTVVYLGKQNTTFKTATLLANDFEISGYTTLDLRAGIASSDDRWRVTAFGRNVTGKSYVTAISTYLDTLIRYRGKPSTYGVSFSYSY